VLAHSQEDSYGVVDLGENVENVLLKGIDFYRDIDNMTITG